MFIYSSYFARLFDFIIFLIRPHSPNVSIYLSVARSLIWLLCHSLPDVFRTKRGLYGLPESIRPGTRRNPFSIGRYDSPTKNTNGSLKNCVYRVINLLRRCDGWYTIVMSKSYKRLPVHSGSAFLFPPPFVIFSPLLKAERGKTKTNAIFTYRAR